MLFLIIIILLYFFYLPFDISDAAIAAELEKEWESGDVAQAQARKRAHVTDLVTEAFRLDASR